MDNTPSPKFVSAQDLIDALRSAEPLVRQAALAFVFPDHAALLVSATPQETRTTSTPKIDPATMFSALLFVQQQVGKMLGLGLQWVPTAQDDSKKLIVAPPGSFR